MSYTYTKSWKNEVYSYKVFAVKQNKEISTKYNFTTKQVNIRNLVLG